MTCDFSIRIIGNAGEQKQEKAGRFSVFQTRAKKDDEKEGEKKSRDSETIRPIHESLPQNFTKHICHDYQVKVTAPLIHQKTALVNLNLKYSGVLFGFAGRGNHLVPSMEREGFRAKKFNGTTKAREDCETVILNEKNGAAKSTGTKAGYIENCRCSQLK
jgi:hypothetical protein